MKYKTPKNIKCLGILYNEYAKYGDVANIVLLIRLTIEYRLTPVPAF